MARPKRTKEQLCGDNWEALFVIYYYGWGIMLLYQLDQYIMLWKNKPRSTFRDEVDRMVEEGILAMHRMNGLYYVRLRQYGVDYILNECGHKPEYEFVRNKKNTAQKSTRAILKSMLANGYLQSRIRKFNERNEIENYESVFKNQLITTSVWFRDGYNHYAIQRYLKNNASRLKQDETEWFIDDIEYRHNQLKESLRNLNHTGGNDVKERCVNYRMPAETTLCTLAKKHVYFWNAVIVKKNSNYRYTSVVMLILEVSKLTPKKITKLIAECEKFCRYYFGRVGSGRIELVVDIAVESKNRSNELNSAIEKQFKTKYSPKILPSTRYRVIPISDSGLNHPMV